MAIDPVRIKIHEEIASQLTCPHGEKAFSYARHMHDSHKDAIEKTIDLLTPINGDKILEIGFASGQHLDYLMSKAEEIRYTGLEVSSKMIEFAKAHIKNKTWEKRIELFEYDGTNFPNHLEGPFDRSFCINTLYFIDNPKNYFSLLSKKIKPNGGFAMTVIDSEFLRKAPFTKYGFKIYDEEEILDLMKECGFHFQKKESVVNKIERLISNEAISKKGQNTIERLMHIYLFKINN